MLALANPFSGVAQPGDEPVSICTSMRSMLATSARRRVYLCPLFLLAYPDANTGGEAYGAEP